METTENKEAAVRRSWRGSLLVAAATVAVGLAVRAGVNPLLGRSVHWDWVGVIAPVLFLALLEAVRRWWVYALPLH